MGTPHVFVIFFAWDIFCLLLPESLWPYFIVLFGDVELFCIFCLERRSTLAAPLHEIVVLHILHLYMIVVILYIVPV